MGFGELHFKTVNDQISIPILSDHGTVHQWCKNNNANYFPYFLMQTPELMASYLKLDIVEFLLTDPTNFINTPFNDSIEKRIIYHKYWPDMPHRPKYSGYEKIGTFLQSVKLNLMEKFPGQDGVQYIPVDLIKKQLYSLGGNYASNISCK